ncbi:MAG: extracellular solute-binding protein [Chloroflexota bacterium]|nr:extracellular solute-binding protein [Chloroflexota bacterium]
MIRRRPVILLIVVLVLPLLAACGNSGGGQPTANSTQESLAAQGGQTTPPAQTGQETPAQGSAGAQNAGSVTMLSTQFAPVEEAEKMRNTILAGFSGKVNFTPMDAGQMTDRVTAAANAGGQSDIGLLGGLHGDFAVMAEKGQLEDLTPLLNDLKDRGFPEDFLKLSQYGNEGKHYYVPWIQASYIMAANKQALQYLPQGADVNKLTYEQLTEWGRRLEKETGQRRIGLPAGPEGLIHRFFQGYLYPSYTNSAGVVKFKSPEAVKMWNQFTELWSVTNPQSTNYGFMQEPLLSEEVWVAWDHAARLIDAVQQRPDDFVLFPAPVGPEGRGYMPVIAGLAIPKNAANRQGAEQLIQYLTAPEQQTATLKELTFFPATNVKAPGDLPQAVQKESEAVQAQANSENAITSLLPVGLGEQGGAYNKVYIDTFRAIVLNQEPVEQVLNQQAQTLQGIMNQTQAGCWPPDPPSDGPCQVK